MRRSRPVPAAADALAAAALAAVTVLAFWRASSYGFLNYDDDLYVTGSAMVQGGLTLSGVVWAFTTVHASNWYPLTLISHMADVSLFGASPAGHHLVSVVLHAASVLLLFSALRRMTGDVARSAAAAALFAVHPLQAESVAWIAERKNVLCGFFSLAAVHLYARYAESPSRRARSAPAASAVSKAAAARAFA